MTDEEPQRRSRWPRRIAIAVVVIVVLLVIVDRIGNYVAERKAGETIESSQHLTSRPDVDIAGFPFLNQLAAGSYDKITVTAKDVVINPRGIAVPISRVQVVLHRLTVSRDFSSFRADSASATALITYGRLGDALHVQLAYVGAGRIKATEALTVAGSTVSGSATAAPQLVNGALEFSAVTVNVLAGATASVTGALQTALGLQLPLNGIPFGVRVQKLSADANGVHIQLAGRNLSYSK